MDLVGFIRKWQPYEYILKGVGVTINDPRLLIRWYNVGHGASASEYNEE